MAKYWLGAVGDCNLCAEPLEYAFIDGKTKDGPWACMCPACYREHGVGLGTGLGQKYLLTEDKRWVKIQG